MLNRNIVVLHLVGSFFRGSEDLVRFLGDVDLIRFTAGVAAEAPDSSSAMRLCASSSSFFRRSFSAISSLRRGSTSLSRKLSTSSMS